MKKLGWVCKEVYLIPASIYYGNDYFIIDYFIAKGPKEELEKLKQAVEEEELLNIRYKKKAEGDRNGSL